MPTLTSRGPDGHRLSRDNLAGAGLAADRPRVEAMVARRAVGIAKRACRVGAGSAGEQLDVQGLDGSDRSGVGLPMEVSKGETRD